MIEVEMTSLEIAKVTGKAHKHINETIRNKLLPAIEIGRDFDPSIFSIKSSTYKDSYNREQKMFVLNKLAATALISYYDISFSCKIAAYIHKLEEELRRKEEELLVMKNIVWEVINGQNYIGQEQALKMAGIKHPRLFMKYLKEDKKFYETVIYKRKFLKSIQCNAEGDKYLKFTKAGFKWLLDSKDKANEWVQGIKKAKAAKPA